MNLRTQLAAAAALIPIVMGNSANALDIFHENYEAPGQTSSTATFSVKGVEDFEGTSLVIDNYTSNNYQPSPANDPTGNSPYTTTFGIAPISGVNPITGVYSGVQSDLPSPGYNRYNKFIVVNHNQYGGVGATGHYISAGVGFDYVLTLTADPTLVPQGINYFGFLVVRARSVQRT
jgi:hypothetical protein